MKKFLALFLALGACVPGETSMLQSRQAGLVVYQAKTAFVPIQSSQADLVRSKCSNLVNRFFNEWRTEKDRHGGAFFGVLYGGVKNGNCVVASESNGNSIPEISGIVRRNCEAAFKAHYGINGTCTPLFHSVPHGIKASSAKTFGLMPGQELLKVIRENPGKFGAMAISTDGAWSVEARPTRAASDQTAVEGCRSVTGLGYDAFSEAEKTAIRDSCTIIYRFGPDFPGAEKVSVVKGQK